MCLNNFIQSVEENAVILILLLELSCSWRSVGGVLGMLPEVERLLLDVVTWVEVSDDVTGSR